MTSYARLLAAFHGRGVKFVVIGVYGSNYYARSGSTLFATQDRDLFLPLDAANEVSAWRACEESGLSQWCSGEPLGAPLDLELAESVVHRRALVNASDSAGLEVDLNLMIAGYDFAEVWRDRRTFLAEGIEIPVARLSHIVRSKQLADRPKDRLFLAAHAEALAAMRDLDEQR